MPFHAWIMFRSLNQIHESNNNCLKTALPIAYRNTAFGVKALWATAKENISEKPLHQDARMDSHDQSALLPPAIDGKRHQ